MRKSEVKTEDKHKAPGSRNFLDMVSSNVNEVIRAVSNLFIFYEKISCVQKHKDVTKQKRKKHKKHKNANKRISDFFPLRCFFKRVKTLSFLLLFAYVCFVLFCACEIFS